jgi:hypothetical protein
MKKIKGMTIMGLLALVVTFLPQSSLAADVSIGFFLGLPIPIVTVDPPREHHVSPPVVYAPAPIPHHGYAYGHEQWRHENFDHNNNSRFHAQRDYDYRDNGHRYGRDRNYSRWDRR